MIYETYSLDKLGTGYYKRETIYLGQLKGFEKNSLVQIYSSDRTQPHTSRYIETPHTTYGASENRGNVEKYFYPGAVVLKPSENQNWHRNLVFCLKICYE